MQRLRKFREIMDILKDFTPDLHQLSIDEALMDMTGTERLWGEPENAAMRIKEKIREATGLTISIGGEHKNLRGEDRFGFEKTDGLCIVREGGKKISWPDCPWKNSGGRGKKRTLLNGTGPFTASPNFKAFFEPAGGQAGQGRSSIFVRSGLGRDPGIYNVESRRSSMSGERTFERDTSERQRLIDALRLISTNSPPGRSGETAHCTLGLKLRFSDFSCIHRQFSRGRSLRLRREILEGAIGCWRKTGMAQTCTLDWHKPSGLKTSFRLSIQPFSRGAEQVGKG
jgi:DNA polymerase-4